jgi:hypothetical protein
MNAKILFAATTLGALAAAFSGIARADSVDPSQQFAIKFQGERTRAEVMAEAARVAATRSIDQPGARAIAPLQSTVDVRTVRSETIDAVRLGKIPSGERSL